jgi:SAM-dependent methyltransferase
MDKRKTTFSFGKNWKEYLENYYDDDKVQEAISSIKSFTELNDFKGKTFVDIGCGSGIFSLAAYRMGAKRIISFDIDDDSIDCCKFLFEKENSPKNWKILKGSILDKKFISGIPKADIVYSWGVLHHTGDMYGAIFYASSLVKKGGLMYIAVYNYDTSLFGSKFYWNVKRVYNLSPTIIKKLMVWSKIGMFFAYNIVTLQNPLKKIREYKSMRGMSWYYDIVDGLGGFPYEYDYPIRVTNFCKDACCMKLVKLKTTNGMYNNEYLFWKVKE